MERALSCVGRKLAAGPAILVPPDTRPPKQADTVMGGPWLPKFVHWLESEAAHYP